ncbi:unnamed protein product [Adineta ricciae]|uniref:Cyclin N-terminal domain-containing protein n=1 Tax=Adineta ricciae TaxID=249248 RepID=A0A815JTQ8_ADIRI|nr:unnamed protein product [Adineta ricciae]
MISSAETHLLATLLSQEDQLHYHQINNIQLPQHVLYILHQLTFTFTPSTSSSSSATLWTAITLLKKLYLLSQQQHPIDLITIVASFTLAHKYQHSQTHILDYHLIAHTFNIHDIQLIHDGEVALLDALSYDISVPTPDDFFSYFSNLANNTDPKIKTIIDEARLALSSPSLSHQTFGVLHNYSPSVVVLSVMYNHLTSNSWMSEQVKKIIVGKKDGDQYVKQLIHCIAELQSVMTSW